MMNVFSPMQGMNAFAQGADIGGNIRQQETQSKLAPLVANGQYQQAAQVAGERGDLGSAELYRTQYEDQLSQMGEQEKIAAAKRAEDLGRVAVGLKGVPYEQRQAMLQQQLPMLQAMGMDPQQIQGFDPNDQNLDAVLAQVTPLQDLLKGPEYFAPVETDSGFAQFSKDGSDPRQFEGIAPAQEAVDQWVDVPAPAGQQGYFQKNERTGAVKRVATPPSGGITIGSDGSVQIGGPARDLGYGSAPKGKEAAIVQGQDGQPLTSPGPQQKVYNQSVQQLADYEAGTDIVTEDINRAIEQAGTWTTGFLGAKLKGVEGTPAHNLQQTLQSIKANVGFDKLQNMRDNSPTGGALGQVTELELGLLQSVWGALEQSQTQEQFVYNLERLGQIKKEFRERKRQALQIDYPELSQTMDFRQQTNEQIQGWSDADEQRLRELEALAGGQ